MLYLATLFVNMWRTSVLMRDACGGHFVRYTSATCLAPCLPHLLPIHDRLLVSPPDSIFLASHLILWSSPAYSRPLTGNGLNELLSSLRTERRIDPRTQQRIRSIAAMRNKLVHSVDANNLTMSNTFGTAARK